MKRLIIQTILILILNNCAIAQTPDWSVNSSGYSNSMSVTCVLVMDGEESADGDDIIGAFINDECRGVKHPVYVEAIDRWVAFLVVFSNESAGTVSFKLYDASTDKVVNALTTAEFETNAHLGLATAPFVWSNEEIPVESEMISFTIDGQSAETHIIDNKVTVIMPAGTDLSTLVPEFELSEYANVSVNNFVQLSGVSEQNFSSPVEYNIHAVNDLDSTTYTVIVYAGDIANFSAANTFSPNSDGINDYWEVDNNEIYRNCDFYIYNINGSLVYHSIGYKNDWDGRHNNSPLPIGTYLYVVKCPECSSCMHKGTISLIR